MLNLKMPPALSEWLRRHHGAGGLAPSRRVPDAPQPPLFPDIPDGPSRQAVRTALQESEDARRRRGRRQ